MFKFIDNISVCSLVVIVFIIVIVIIILNYFCESYKATPKNKETKNLPKSSKKIRETFVDSVPCSDDGRTKCVCKDNYKLSDPNDPNSLCICEESCENLCASELNSCGESCVNTGIKCGDNGTCFNGSCTCENGWSGNRCEIPPPACYGLCQNGGKCKADGECDCSDIGFKGPTCEEKINCYGLCQNGSTCNRDTGVCDCLPDFSGDFCEKDDLCLEKDCGVNSYCSRGNCLCNRGWEKDQNGNCTIEANFIEVSTNIPSADGFHIFDNTRGIEYTDWPGISLPSGVNEYTQTFGDYSVSIYVNGSDNNGNRILTARVNDVEVNDFEFLVISNGDKFPSSSPDIKSLESICWFVNNTVLYNNPFCDPPCPIGAICTDCFPTSCKQGYRNIGGDSIICEDTCNTDFGPQDCGNSLGEDGNCFAGECTCEPGFRREGGVCVELPEELPPGQTFPELTICDGSDVGVMPNQAEIRKRRWQTPKRGRNQWRSGYEDRSDLVGFSSIRYTNSSRTSANVDVIATYRYERYNLSYNKRNLGVTGSPETFSYTDMESYTPTLDNFPRAKGTFTVNNTDSNKKIVTIKAYDPVLDKNYFIELPYITFIWQVTSLKTTEFTPHFDNGRRGAMAELFMWPHRDIKAESEFLANSGYLGAKLFPIHEQVMGSQPPLNKNYMNPWYYAYQPVSYNLDGRGGTLEELESMINTSRGNGLRIYTDVILNHFSGQGNDIQYHRQQGVSTTPQWYPKTTSGNKDITIYDNPDKKETASPYFTSTATYIYNPNTNEGGTLEFPGASVGPLDFHCSRTLGNFDDLNIAHYGWLVNLTDLKSDSPILQERQVAYMVDLWSRGITGWRIDAAKHFNSQVMVDLMVKFKEHLGGELPDDFIIWAEVLRGGGGDPKHFTEWGWDWLNRMRASGFTEREIDMMKIWNDVFPRQPNEQYGYGITKRRQVFQQDDHDTQSPGSSSRDIIGQGGNAGFPEAVVLVKAPGDWQKHRDFNKKLFTSDGYGGIPIVNILSSYYPVAGSSDGIGPVPDGLSDASYCNPETNDCSFVMSVPRNVQNPKYDWVAHDPEATGYVTGDDIAGKYTQAHRDPEVISAMQDWLRNTSSSTYTISYDETVSDESYENFYNNYTIPKNSSRNIYHGIF